MKCSSENGGLGEILFCDPAVINRPPPELLPLGVLELLNYQAGRNSAIQKPNPYVFPHLSSTPCLSLKEIVYE